MRPSVPALPPALHTTLRPFRFLFHADTWPVFLCLLAGVLTGHTALAGVRASLLSAGVTWRQCCDFYRRARWSRTAFLRATTSLVLHTLYPEGLPTRLWWVADTTRRGRCLASGASGATVAAPAKQRSIRGTAGCCWPISTGDRTSPGRRCWSARCCGSSCAAPPPAA